MLGGEDAAGCDATAWPAREAGTCRTWECCCRRSMTAGAILAISRVKKEKAWPSLASRPVRPTLRTGQRSSSRAGRR